MILNAEAEHYDIVNEINNSFDPLLTKLFGNDDKKVKNPEAMLFDLARNNILNACKEDGHVKPPEWFISEARKKINEIKVMIHNKKMLILKILKRLRGWAEKGMIKEVKQEILEIVNPLERDLFEGSQSLQARKFDLARNAVLNMCSIPQGPENLRKLTEDVISDAYKNSASLIAQLDADLS